MFLLPHPEAVLKCLQSETRHAAGFGGRPNHFGHTAKENDGTTHLRSARKGERDEWTAVTVGSAAAQRRRREGVEKRIFAMSVGMCGDVNRVCTDFVLGIFSVRPHTQLHFSAVQLAG